MDDDSPVPIPITDVFDLHSVPPRDAEGIVEAYLEEAHARGFRYVRIIHGRGIGVQREMVRRVRGMYGVCGIVFGRTDGRRRMGRNGSDAARVKQISDTATS